YEGFYQAQIPQSQLEEWGVADHPTHQLFGEYKSSERNLTVEDVDGGISVDVSNISYSASYVDIKADSTAPVPESALEDDSSNQDSGDDSSNQDSGDDSSSQNDDGDDSSNQDSGDDSSSQNDDGDNSSNQDSGDDSSNQDSGDDSSSQNDDGDDSSSQNDDGDNSSNQDSGDDSSSQNDDGDNSSNQDSGDDSSSQNDDGDNKPNSAAAVGAESGSEMGGETGGESQAGGGDGSSGSSSDAAGGGSSGGSSSGDSGGNSGGSSSGNSGGSSSGSGSSTGSMIADALTVITAPLRWFGSLSTAGKAAVAATTGAGAAGAAYGLGGDRIQTPLNIARRRFQSWLRRRIRGSSRSQISKLLARLRRLKWAKIRTQIAGVRKYFTRSYWREFIAKRRRLGSRKGMKSWLKSKYRGNRKRKYRGWLRGRLRGGVNWVAGGLLRGAAPAWLGVVSGPAATAVSVITGEIRRWIEDKAMDRFDSTRKRYAKLAIQSSAWITTVETRLWQLLSGEDSPSSSRSLAAIAGESASELNEVGVDSVDQLASADPEQLASALEIDESAVAEWVNRAGHASGSTERPAFIETRNGKRIQARYEQIAEIVQTGVSIPTISVGSVHSITDIGGRQLARVTGWLQGDVSSILSRAFERIQSFSRRLLYRVSIWIYGPSGAVESIDGIGPEHSDRLVEEGITDVAVLSACSAERLSERINVSSSQTYRWITQATAETPDTRGLHQRLVAGVVRVESVFIAMKTKSSVQLESNRLREDHFSSQPLSEKEVNQLAVVGITTVSQLAAINPDRLGAGVGIDAKTAEEWVEMAQVYEMHLNNNS
ncbi:helix-hairpin-helix domain-containing protein, partial [Haloquadratum walsbyi]|uniref:helix-hairpin-helix domain-containing protein n=1 Tax=Haloquadratum walsbyi TaxID=293091 RepID=UPI0023F526D3